MKLVESKIKELENVSSAEIVVAIIPRSSAVRHVFPLSLVLMVLLVETTFIWFEIPRSLELLLFTSVLGLSLILSQRPFFQRLFTSEKDLMAQVEKRALLEFYQAGLEKTEGHTGILFFISRMEHRTVVLADKGIASLLGPETWAKSVDLINHGIRSGQLEEGIVRALGLSEDTLKKHFPKKANDVNELSNSVRFLES